MVVAQHVKGAPAGWDAAWPWPLALSPHEGQGEEAEGDVQCMGLELMAAVSLERGMVGQCRLKPAQTRVETTLVM